MTAAEDKQTESGEIKPDAPKGSDDASSGGKPRPPNEIGGRDGPDPTRYGDWEKAGRCIDF